ncbi:uncharacterized protein STEHIDRAFT_163536 [Stereum hirsutum FP-91666 SS1]|uniref:Nephrocystin 3-like N-terminal domain-containing protein n=1 Tax=Stereum hirsutum (strain FP-91666) TaxID=721885 RepID=R7RY37_STEHR|nr:uncharacterized protein STEHIDRAFT_163536 [Stereum hirsutum FP-91666 SS1]EIM79718.1 hypothetical protein STEHIDRAFT_163536 [Stereum hirsutum FP-91666 SS1]
MNKASISIERPGPHVIIIDALDECTDNELFSSPILGALLDHFKAFRQLGLKFFVTSRPVSGIVSTFNRADTSSYRDILYLHDMNPTTVDRDIRAYVTYTLQVMARNRQGHVPPSFPDDEVVESIVKASGQLFIFAATICKFIADSSYQSPAHIMHQFTTTSPTTPHVERIIRFEELGRLYQLVFKDAFRGEADRNNDRAKSRLRLVIAAIVLVFTPLPKDDLAELLGSEYTPSVIQMLLTHMHSVIHVPEDDTRPIRPLHASFGDHITTKRESTTPDDINDYFYVHPPTYHAYLADFCFRVMENHLVRANICGLPRNEDYVAISNLAECRKRTLTRALEYACCHWGDHLVAALNVGETLAGGEEHIQTVIGGARKFATVRLLRWIDILSVIQELDKAAPMLMKARESLTVS